MYVCMYTYTYIYFQASWFQLFFNFYFLLYLFSLLYNIVLVLPYIDMNPPWVYICSSSWTPLLPPSPSHPSGSSQCTSPEHPVLCIEPGLAIRFTYDNLHVSVKFLNVKENSNNKKYMKWQIIKSFFHLCPSPQIRNKTRMPTISVYIHYWEVLASIVGEGNVTLFQYSCLENPMDGGV